MYYSSEQKLRAEIVYKILKFFGTRQAYRVSDLTWHLSLSDYNAFAKSGAETGAQFIASAGRLLEIHLQGAVLSEELGRCMDDITLDSLDYIPPGWTLVAQVCVAVWLFDSLYRKAKNPVSELFIPLNLC